jgi:hypothetical protein
MLVVPIQAKPCVPQIAQEPAAPVRPLIPPQQVCRPALALEADYLLWWTKRGPLPGSLVTAAPAGNTAAANDPNTSVLFGNESVNFGAQSGLRVGATYFADPRSDIGFELGFFWLARQTANFTSAGSAGGNLVVLQSSVSPNGQETGLEVALPGSISGYVTVGMSTRLIGTEANILLDELAPGTERFRPLIGLRYIGLRERYRESVFVASQAPNGISLNDLGVTSIVQEDLFAAETDYYAAQVGFRYGVREGIFDFDLVTKVGLGWSHQRTFISGTSTADTGEVGFGGFRALSSNIGSHDKDAFAVMTEVGGNLGVYLTDNVRFRAGYTFLYLNSVMRPGQQIDRAIDQTIAPGNTAFIRGASGTRPAFQGRSTDFYVHGLNFGLEMLY